MENRVYYGEYSLSHWINLLLRRNIVLPQYQRYFVWNEQKVKNLVSSLKNKQFIPPVTIGSFSNNGDSENLILDGQQRLTSVLLAYLGIYPDVAAFKSTLIRLANENDDPEEDLEEDPVDKEDSDYYGLDNILEWNINNLTKKGKEKDEILKALIQGNYKSIEIDIEENFFDENYLGFCYLVPNSDDIAVQQRYYSSVFRNINIQGQALLPQESRASLYFLDESLVQLFSPNFFDKVKIKLISSNTKADFLRYLTLLSQYHMKQDTASVARGYKQKMENLYEEFIHAAIKDEGNKLFPKFTSVFPEKKYQNRINNLEQTMRRFGLYRSYSSIIDVDIIMFGLVYQIVFLENTIDLTRQEHLKNELDNTIEEVKIDDAHLKSPNNLTHLRTRINLSIKAYERFITK